MAGDMEDLPRVEPERMHSCEVGERLRQETDGAQAEAAKETLGGRAVTRIEYASGRWGAHDEEYSSVVRFCSCCGEELRA